MNKESIKNKIPYIFFAFITIFICGFFLIQPAVNWGGDIIEYFGIGTSYINHQSPELTKKDVQDLQSILNPAYLNDPQYYIKGVDGNRHPVHFVFYSILTIPFRLILPFFSIDEVKALVFTNLAILSLTVLYCLKKIKDWRKKLVFLLLIYFSPLISFIVWPGPDMLYTCLVLISLFLFQEKKYLYAAAATALASWHSQPLIIFSGFYLLLFFLQESRTVKKSIPAVGIIFILFFPYLFNKLTFGVWTPWTIIQNIWTQYYGFGLQNIHVYKLWEQLFDLNMGIFWYMPIIFILGISSLIKRSIRELPVAGLGLALIVTAFFYQTNPAWNYGTAGYGPTRHILFLLPVLIFFSLGVLNYTKKTFMILFFIVATQIWILSFNGFLLPNFLNSLAHNPIAMFAIDRFPAFYNPTPEIFIDRTTHTDLDYPITAIYKKGNSCKKVYALPGGIEYVKSECKVAEAKGLKPAHIKYQGEEIKMKTTQATLYPIADCAKSTCLKSARQVIAATDLDDGSRLKQISPNVWLIAWGSPFTLTVPKNYSVDYYSFTGKYINY